MVVWRYHCKAFLQGNGAGPAIWMSMSIPIINMLRTQGFGFQSFNLLTAQKYYFVCFTSVDDTDLLHTGQPNTTEPKLLSEMQQMLNYWDGGLKATGGALVPSKSYWYGIAFKWHPTKLKWIYKTISEMRVK
jgi:hypothetical protein